MLCKNLVTKFSGATALITRFMGPIWGLPGTDRAQVGSILAPWSLLSGGIDGVEQMGFQLPITWTSSHDRQDKGTFVFVFRNNAANKGRTPRNNRGLALRKFGSQVMPHGPRGNSLMAERKIKVENMCFSHVLYRYMICSLKYEHHRKHTYA